MSCHWTTPQGFAAYARGRACRSGCNGPVACVVRISLIVAAPPSQLPAPSSPPRPSRHTPLTTQHAPRVGAGAGGLTHVARAPYRRRPPDPRGTRPAPAPASEAGPPVWAMPSTRIAFRPRLSFSRPSEEETSRPESSRTRSSR
jgi:hypothetical protein